MIGKSISHYKIIEKLGSGGMGVVYKAQDTKLDRFVALKFLPPGFGTDEEEKQRFIHEAKAASGLDHTNICTIHEIDETEPAPGEPGAGPVRSVASSALPGRRSRARSGARVGPARSIFPDHS